MKFKTPEGMLYFINRGNDLYSPKAEIYIFNYNDAGSVCTYNISKEEATELAKKVQESEELYWGALLGPGGEIWDSPAHDCYKEGQASNLDRCKELIKFEDWVLTENWFVYLQAE